MGERVRTDMARVYADVAIHAGVEIRLAMERDEGEGAAIYIGLNGPDMTLDFADAESLDRLAEVAADGARQLRNRIAAYDRAAAEELVRTGRSPGAEAAEGAAEGVGGDGFGQGHGGTGAGGEAGVVVDHGIGGGVADAGDGGDDGADATGYKAPVGTTISSRLPTTA